MKSIASRGFLCFILAISFSVANADQPVIKSTGIAPGLVVSSKITLDFTGPEVSELGLPNSFLDYRMTVEFSQGDAKVTVPGYFAADGTASESSEDSGNVWQVYFWMDVPGEWTYRVSFVSRDGGAINYLSAKRVNAMSFLTCNVGGDGNNVWSHVLREAKLHFDCSRLDQQAVVFDHAQAKGILNFRKQGPIG